MTTMSFKAAFRGILFPLSQCSSCCDLRFQNRPCLAPSSGFRHKRHRRSAFKLVQNRRSWGKREIVCRVTEPQTESGSNNGEEKETHKNGETQSLLDSSDEQYNPQPLDADHLNKFTHQNEHQNDEQSADSVEISGGSPLPGVKPQQLDEAIKIPKETIEILKNQVFGFDTFFVTSQDPYEGGVLFNGNLRGQAARSYEKILKRMQDKFGDQYKLFLLVNPEDDKPVAVVVPRMTLPSGTTAVREWFAAGAFGLVALFTLLLHNVPALQSNIL